MSKSIIYVANTQSQTGGTVNFGNVVRKYGCNLAVSGGNVQISGQGYYDIDVNLTLQNTTADAVTETVTVNANGAEVTGATITQTIGAGAYEAVTIPCVVRTFCCLPVAITVDVSGGAVVTNASIVVEKE